MALDLHKNKPVNNRNVLLGENGIKCITFITDQKELFYWCIQQIEWKCNCKDFAFVAVANFKLRLKCHLLAVGTVIKCHLALPGLWLYSIVI